MFKRIICLLLAVTLIIAMSFQNCFAMSAIHKDGEITYGNLEFELPLETEIVTATDLKYGITFAHNKLLKTDKGDSALTNAEFIEKDGKYELAVGMRAFEKNFAYVFLVAYNQLGQIVDYQERFLKPYWVVTREISLVVQPLTYEIKEGNPLGITRIDFTTDISLIDPTIHARKYVDQRTYNPKDYPDAYTFYFMSGYYDEAEATKRYNKYLADVQEIAENFRKEMERHKLIVFN